MDAGLLDRIEAALAAGPQTPTPDLAALLIEAGGEQCWQRGRLLRRLTILLHSVRPIMSKSTTHRFKAGFKEATAILNDPDTRVVSAENLTDADVPLLQQYGYGHLIEPIPAPEKKAAKPEAPEAEAEEAKPAAKKHK